MSKKYEPSPLKLAIYCCLNKRRVMEVMELIKLDGAGDHMTTNQLEHILRLALKECDVIQKFSTSK